MSSENRRFSVDITNFPESGGTTTTKQFPEVATPISNEEISKLFAGRNLVFISTLSADGSPNVTPVWADMEDNGLILINSFEGSAKVKNASRDPRVAVSIVDANNTYNAVSIKGKMIEITTEGADEHIRRLAKKYLGIGKYYYRKPKRTRIIMKIKPEKIVGMSIHPASLFLAYRP